MSETTVLVFAAFFAVIGPFDMAAILVAITGGHSQTHRRTMAERGTLNAAGSLGPASSACRPSPG